MWKAVVLLVCFGAGLYLYRSNQNLELERARLDAERAKFEAQAAEAKRDRPAPKAVPVPSDEELRKAAAQVFGDLQEQAASTEASFPVVVEPELKANALVVWQVTERNSIWHRVSYSVEAWSMVPQTLDVDLDVNILNANGLPLDQKRHRGLVLPGDGRRMKVADFELVTCPACFDVAKVEAAMAIRRGR